MDSSPLLTAQEVSVRHRKKGALAVDSVTLTVEAGTCVAILGPNGAGKSTLLRSLAGLSMGETTGSIQLHGEDISQLSAREMARRRAFVPQDNPMPFAFTVRESVGLGGEVSTVDAALAAFDLMNFAERSVLALSGGERQRVAIARAFAQSASLLLLDEPTAHQDLRYQRQILDAVQCFVRSVPKERAAIAVLHDLNIAAAWADTVYLLHRGRLVTDGNPDEVLTAELLTKIYETNIAIKPLIHAVSSTI